MVEKIIFLDIDGTLNNHTANGIFDPKSTDKNCINLINRIIELTDCYIFIISNWAQQLEFKQLCELLYERGLLPSIVGAIEAIHTDKDGLVLGIEKDSFIKKYIDDHPGLVYVIIDDNLDSSILEKSKIVKPNTFNGITEKEATQAIKILNEI